MPSEAQVGRPLKRKEDVGLVTGRERYVSDILLPGARHVASLDAKAKTA
jgi:CO/xanthine dehydrogenase Mo-binding subunit